jgi:protoheme IX farnesyltransferase
MTSHLTTFRKLALAAVIATYVMVVIGVVVRSTGSGMGCPDWPLCHGRIVPELGDSAAWIESIHRWWGVLVGIVVLSMTVAAVRPPRQPRSVMAASLAALLLTGVQAWLGKVTVETGNSGESVSAHLATAMLLLATTIFAFVRSGYDARLAAQGGSQRLSLIIAFAAASVYALMLFGAHVTSTRAALVFPDWPLMGGQLIPVLSDDPAVAELEASHVAHRLAAVIVGAILLAASYAAWRASRRSGMVEADGGATSGVSTLGAQRLLALVGTATALYAVQVVVGALQLWTTLAPWAVSLHLALGAAIWCLLVAATVYSWCDARRAVAARSAPSAEGLGHGSEPPPTTLRGKVSAFVALTKPRIVELLLITTVPAMVLAWRSVGGVDAVRFAWLVAATLIGGALAAGAANAINCYLDRDIDEVMARTRRRPLPAHQVGAEDALAFGLVLTVVSFAWLAVTTNLVAAFLALLAVGFYVVVYTLLLKRSTPQNIVLGGAAGALPPVIGWAAVSGDIALPALLLFAVIFYWTPPHFWALALRIRGDYAAARVPMLPVTHGVPETTRQIALYSVLMVALTLVFFAVARMGLLFLAGSLVLGGLFLLQAFAMARERSDARAVRLYRYSITYLSGLFGLIILDVAASAALG